VSIYSLKEQEVLDTPVLLFECKLADGAIERWATHEVSIEGSGYAARIVSHNAFELRAGSEDGIDGASRLSVTLANADSHFSQIERTVGFRGASLVVRFAFYDLRMARPTTSPITLFKGTANPPELCTESTFRLTFTSRLNLQRVLLPNIRIQRRCAWHFPATEEQRAEAVHGGESGKYSRFFKCGYSPDQELGVGNLNGDAPFTSCGYTKEDCKARGMFDRDGAGRTTARFGGIGFVPASVLVRSAGESGRHISHATENTARYNDFVPMVYGTAWVQPPVVFARNDGNLTRMEVLAAIGEIQGVVKVLVNGVEIPSADPGRDMSSTGWFQLVSAGNRTGAFNLDFADSLGRPLGEPYGSMAYLSVVVPNRVSDGRTLPRVEVLLEGLKVSVFDSAGNYVAESYTNNPAWVILDILRRIGWALDDLDLASFGRAADWCGQTIQARDLNGNLIEIPRYQCNLALRRRQSAAEVIRGVRTASGLILTYGLEGRLELRIEDKIANQQPEKPSGSNSSSPVFGGWPAYEFGDGTNGSCGILRRESGESTLQIFSRPLADTPNRMSLEFQDAFNEYQQDSVSLIDAEDVLTSGQEVAGSVHALGVANLDQAMRVVRRYLARSVHGNTFVEFETSIRGLTVRPGDLISLSYLKEGFDRQLFRVIRIAPSTNFRTVVITAQIHDDAWYEGEGGDGGRRRRQQRGETGIPRPLVGKRLDEDGNPEFEVEELALGESDGGSKVLLRVGFATPPNPSASRASIPRLSLAAEAMAEGGTLAAGQTLYYAFSAVDTEGVESGLSFTVRVRIPEGAPAAVRLRGLSFDPDATAMCVYRGVSPQQLDQIAKNIPLSTEFIDSGLANLFSPPPDPDYDHANFHWRFEERPAMPAIIASASTVGHPSLTMILNEHRGSAVRILAGPGSGQERRILANDANTVAIDRPWVVMPTSDSRFVIAEASWRFGAMSRTDRAEFEVPNRGGVTIQISGRSANARDEECPAELSPITRWRVGGASGAEGLDGAEPGEPVFGMFAAGDGNIEVLSVGFTELDNTRTISGGTISLYYWDELSSPTTSFLQGALDEAATTIQLTSAGAAAPGSYIQTGAEVMEVLSVTEGEVYEVGRGAFGTPATTHAAGSGVFHLKRRVIVMPFVRDFFGSPASGSFSFPIYLPNARVAAAELFVTNSRGNSPTAKRAFTANVDRGIRTFSGRQLLCQVDGFLAIESGASPVAIVGGWRAVRDVFAVVREAPTGGPVVLRVLVNNSEYCTLTIPAGAVLSNTVSGFNLPPLPDGATVSVDIVSVPSSGAGSPGRDLTVTIRS
jgi:hypothetical protein